MSVRLASICTNTHTRRHAHLFLHVLLAWQLWAFRRDCWHLGVASCLLAGTKAAHALLFFHSRKSVIVERESGKGVSRASLRRLLPVRSFCSRSEAFALAQKLALSGACSLPVDSTQSRAPEPTCVLQSSEYFREDVCWVQTKETHETPTFSNMLQFLALAAPHLLAIEFL